MGTTMTADPPTPRDIAKLPKRLRETLGMVAVNQDQFCNRAPLQALERRGLIESYTEQVFGQGSSVIDRIPLTVTRYRVPLPVHIAWSEWCAEQLDSDPDAIDRVTPKEQP